MMVSEYTPSTDANQALAALNYWIANHIESKGYTIDRDGHGVKCCLMIDEIPYILDMTYAPNFELAVCLALLTIERREIMELGD